jgi:hypothetical protein
VQLYTLHKSVFIVHFVHVWRSLQQTLAREGCNIGFLLDERQGSTLVRDLSLFSVSVWSRHQQTLARERCNIGFLLDEGQGSTLVRDLSLFSARARVCVCVCVEQTSTDTGEGGMKY